VRKHESAGVWQVLPMLLAAVLLTLGIAMFLSGTNKPAEIIQPVIVVFGGMLASLLVTFAPAQLWQALQVALLRGVYGGTSPGDMITAMLNVCDICRRDGLLGVAEVRSNNPDVEMACQLVGDAATQTSIQFNLDRRLAAEHLFHRMVADVFVFAIVFAVLMGALGTLLRVLEAASTGLTGSTALPAVIGISVAILLCVLLGRLRGAHSRALMVTELAYRAASMILEDNNVQRLRSQLVSLVPPGLQR